MAKTSSLCHQKSEFCKEKKKNNDTVRVEEKKKNLLFGYAGHKYKFIFIGYAGYNFFFQMDINVF